MQSGINAGYGSGSRSPSPFTKRSRRYEMNQLVANQSAVNSPFNATTSNVTRRLDADSLQQLPGNRLSSEVVADAKSFRSKRSLSINVNKVSKITKIHNNHDKNSTTSSRALS